MRQSCHIPLLSNWKTPKEAGILGHWIRLPFVFLKFPLLSQSTQKCKLLLHLGNFRAFLVDNEWHLKYDFLTACHL